MAVSQPPPMAFWDPGNLLQVTDDTRGGVVQCVGRTKKLHAARCRYTIDDPTERAGIHAALAGLATRRPADVGREELRRLAVACLCTEHHRRSQPPAVTEKWVTIVRCAATHHDSLLKAERERLRTEIRQEQQRQQQQQQQEETPPPSYSATQPHGEAARSRLEGLEKACTQLQLFADAAQADNEVLRRKLAESAEKANRARADADERAAALEADIEAAVAQRDDNSIEVEDLQAELDDLNAVVNEEREEMGRLRSLHNATLKIHQDERERHDEERQRLKAEAWSATGQLAMARAELLGSELSRRATEEAAAAELADLRSAHDTEIKALEDARADIDEELQRLTAEAVLTAEELRKARADLCASKASLGELAERLGGAREEARWLAARAEMAEAVLAGCRDECKVETERADEAELKIAMCRLHGLGTWIGRRSKRGKGEQKKKKPVGETEAAASELEPGGSEAAAS